MSNSKPNFKIGLKINDLVQFTISPPLMAEKHFEYLIKSSRDGVATVSSLDRFQIIIIFLEFVSSFTLFIDAFVAELSSLDHCFANQFHFYFLFLYLFLSLRCLSVPSSLLKCPLISFCSSIPFFFKFVLSLDVFALICA